MLFKKKKHSLLTNSGKERIEATLIFSEAEHKLWLKRILKPGFSHVRVVIHKKYVSTYIDPRVSYTYMECFARGDTIPINEGETHLRIVRMVDIYKLRRVFGPLNCVETVKSFIGLSAPLVFTPYQLYKRLKHDT